MKKRYKYVLCDIEGTTTSKSFVLDILFPYFVEHIEELNWESPEVEAVWSRLEERLNTTDEDEIIDQLLTWVEEDIKDPDLKQLQGISWKTGYENGEIHGHIFPEIRDVFEAWDAQGTRIGIYSSGSVAAQKLLFRNSIDGDLSPFISNYFDTSVGPKRETSSYQNILNELSLPGHYVLFLSDIPEELTAAHEAGMEVLHVVREDTLPNPDFTSVYSLTDIETL